MKTKILDEKQIEHKWTRIAWQVYESNYQEKEIVIAGINGNGFELAKKLSEKIEEISELNTILAEVKIDKNIPFDHAITSELEVSVIKDKAIILVDDVLNSGKTLIYGIKHLLQGPIKKLNTAILIDRNHNRFPIQSDYTGLRLSTSSHEHVRVILKGEEKGAYLE